jgi:uncharacterized repeat protein (TIGR01451 family)
MDRPAQSVSSVAAGRQASRTIFSFLATCLLAIAALWSGQAQAITNGCQILSNPPLTQSGAPTTALTYTFVIDEITTGDCGPGGVSGTVQNNFDNTGGATASTPWSGLPGQTITITITLGNVPSQTSQWTIECTADCYNGPETIVINANTTATPVPTIAVQSGNNQAALFGTTFAAPLVARLIDADGSTPSTGVGVNWSVSGGTGSVSFSNAQPADASGDASVEITATGSGPVQIRAERQDNTAIFTTFNATVNEDFTLTINGASTVNAAPGEVLAVSVDYLVDGAPASLTTNWTSGDPGNVVPTSPSVTASGTHNNGLNAFGSPGTYTVTVAGGCPTAKPDCPPPSVTYTVVIEDPVLTVASPPDGTAVMVNTPLTITANFAGPTRPAVDGTNIEFTVISEPTPGAGSFSVANVGTVGGNASSDFTGTVPGTYTIQVCDAWDGCLGETATINIIVNSATMTVTKSLAGFTDNDGSGNVSEGDVLAFTVQMDNTGTIALTNVDVNDPLLSPATINCAVVAVSSNCVLSGSYTVTLADVSAGSFTNTGNATSNEVPGPVSSNTVTTPVFTSPELTVNKSVVNADGDGSGTVTEGDVLTYTVSAQNTGNVVLTNTAVSDPLISPTPLVCTPLAVGAFCDLSGPYTVTAADVTAGSISNTGTADSTETAPVTDTLVTPVAGSPALTVDKSLTGNADGDSSGTVTEGDVLTYTVSAANTGNIGLTNVVVGDPLLAPASTNCATLAVGVSCDLVGTYTVTAADVTAGTINNTGTATASEITGSATDSHVLAVVGTPAMTIGKTFDGFVDNDGSSSITEGDQLDYTATATNTGNVPLTNVSVDDGQLTPANATCASVLVGSTCVLSGAHIVTNADVLAGNVTNIAAATSDETGTINSAPVVVPVVASPAMTIGKTFDSFTDTDSSGSVTEGDILFYTATATNSGNIALTGVSVDDAQLSPANATCPGVPVAGTCVLSGSHTVTNADVLAGNVTNTASADSNETAPVNSTPVVTPVVGSPDMTVAKTLDGFTDNDGSGTVTEGDVLNYTLTASRSAIPCSPRAPISAPACRSAAPARSPARGPLQGATSASGRSPTPAWPIRSRPDRAAPTPSSPRWRAARR